MNTPIFIKFNDELINLSQCTRICREDETIYFYFTAGAEDYTSFEYDSDAEAVEGLEEVRTLLADQGLLGNLNPPPK